MKTNQKHFLISLFLLLPFLTFSQDIKDTEAYNNSLSLNQTGRVEVKYNLLTSVIGFPEISVEKLIGENSGLGGSLAITIFGDMDYKPDYLLTYYRIYFGKKLNNGIFVEANSGLIRSSYTEYTYSDDLSCYQCSISKAEEITSINFGIGFGIGYKLLSKNGLISEIYGGLGRIASKSDEINLYPRVGITLGKRSKK